MGTVASVIGGVGGVLVLVGLVGGGFEFSGALMPKVGSVSRVLCSGVGGVLLVIAIGLAVADSAGVRSAADRSSEPSGSSVSPGTTTAGGPAASGSGSAGSGSGSAGSGSGSSGTDASSSGPGLFVGRALTSPGYDVRVFELPTSSSSVIASIPSGGDVGILCTAQGEAVTSPVTGLTSSLWNGTTDGGFVPDVMVDTGTTQAVMPSCTG